MSHAMLIGLLMHLGGSFDMPADALSVDALGTPDGTFHAVELGILEDGQVRLSVVPRPHGEGAGLQFRNGE
ncbi:pRL2-19 [Streptomyces kaniharaensis]|uniref:PRL2-19 n=2 Tax=Streptomyces kaniharaensis TaxID=212423 RepID=A0A6N7L5I4_9ACTN|nr:pRL2-19 [Streptomyces kaniharaensis]MQS18066.1 pRL2-19 [Streptomyces kaniharaensis]MQS18155.1 pRL2-19 [Streptomyces kaniharaensis]MQS18176.1 pRL2-19 [Streptomyces kaniharaensis]MQS18179.1 pRL2-19 [Streptomyces kaniharaensis]